MTWLTQQKHSESKANFTGSLTIRHARRASAATVLEEFDRQKSIGQYPGRSLADAFAAEIAAKGDIYAWLHSRVQDADFSGLRIGDYMDVPVAAGSNVPAQTVRYLLAAVDPYYQCSDSPMPHHLAFVPPRRFL